MKLEVFYGYEKEIQPGIQTRGEGHLGRGSLFHSLGECHSPAVADVAQAWRRGRAVT